jgi:putative DNA primase/helicase
MGLAEASGLGESAERIEAGYLEQSPSGGFHWLYRCPEISGNIKLARRPKAPDEMNDPEDKIKVLIETRGEGGYIVVAPSHGRVHPSGKRYVLLRGNFETIAAINIEERESLFELARTFDLMPKPQAKEPAAKSSGKAEGRPGDDFNVRGVGPISLNPMAGGWYFSATALLTGGDPAKPQALQPLPIMRAAACCTCSVPAPLLSLSGVTASFPPIPFWNMATTMQRRPES